MKKSEHVFTENELRFHKVRSKPVQDKGREKGSGIGNMATKAVIGAALTGDLTGAIGGVPVDKVVGKIIR